MAAPGLCALERENEVRAVAHNAERSLEAQSSNQSVPSSSSLPQHIDDCFCCSHCVDVSRPVVVIELAGDIGGVAAPALRQVDNVPPPPYHPPLS